MEMSPPPKKNDVFISFRGEDSRTRFTDHLRAALEREGIKAYMDDYLRRGEEIWPSLSQAIEDSHVAVVVFSENYTNSSWCLEELVKIIEYRKRDGQVVIPVFYEVDPSHIRKQTGPHGEALAKYEQRLLVDKDKEGKVPEWKAALTEAASTSGWDTRNRGCGVVRMEKEQSLRHCESGGGSALHSGGRCSMRHCPMVVR